MFTGVLPGKRTKGVDCEDMQTSLIFHDDVKLLFGKQITHSCPPQVVVHLLNSQVMALVAGKLFIL